MVYFSKILFMFFFVAILIGCAKKETQTVTLDKGEIPVVTVKGKTLYADELEKALPIGLSPADSTTAADSYIKRWISEVLLYEKAKSNISNLDQIDKLVEDYRQSLTVYTYQEKLLNEVLSGNNKEQDLKTYYDNNISKFKLNSFLIKGLFLKIPKSSSELNNLRKWYQSNSPSSKENIEKASIQNAVIYNYFYDNWMNLEEVTSNLPGTISDPSQFLRNNKNYETTDSTYVYLLHVEEYVLPGSTTPYDYAKTQIKDLLINQERNSFLKKLETDLYNDGLENGEIKFYNKE